MSWVAQHRTEFQHHEAALMALKEACAGHAKEPEIEFVCRVLRELVAALGSVDDLAPAAQGEVQTFLTQLREFLDRETLVEELTNSTGDGAAQLRELGDTAERVRESLQPTVRT